MTLKEQQAARREQAAADYDRAVQAAVLALGKPQPRHIQPFVEVMRKVDQRRAAEALAAEVARSAAQSSPPAN